MLQISNFVHTRRNIYLDSSCQFSSEFRIFPGLHLSDELLRRHAEGGGPDVHLLALVQPGEGHHLKTNINNNNIYIYAPHLARAPRPLHLAEPEDDHAVVLGEGDDAPPVADGEGEEEEEVGEGRDQPHDHRAHQGGRVGLVRHVLQRRVWRTFSRNLQTSALPFAFITLNKMKVILILESFKVHKSLFTDTERKDVTVDVPHVSIKSFIHDNENVPVCHPP